MMNSLFHCTNSTEYGISSFQSSHAGDSLRHSVHEGSFESVVLVPGISFPCDSLTSSINIVASEALSGTYILGQRSLNIR